ncbi:terpenoid synthase [Xylariaceae sp. FL0662B]|nr:terpenoid synthase [Xylariaceae sp. FL0662B]
MAANVSDNKGVIALESFRGKVLKIPDLRPIYANWKSGLSPHCEVLRTFVHDKIDKYVKDENARLKTKAIDLGWFTSVIYPNGDLERLKMMAMVSMTFFVFDDTVDKEIGTDMLDFASNFDTATRLRQQSIAYMRYWFSPETNVRGSNGCDTPVPEEFASFDALVPGVITAPQGQINLPKLADDFQEFIDDNAVEQTHRLSGNLPTVEEYWAYRHGVGAVFAYCTLHQYATNTILPDELSWSEEVMIMRLEASTQTILCNDLFSLKKEVKEDTPTNLIPIMMAKSGLSLESAIHELIEQMYSSARRFDLAVASLRSKGRGYDDSIQEQLERFIESFETFQTGCFTFFMNARRYRVADYKQEDGQFLIPL